MTHSCDPTVHTTKIGTPYLRGPGVALVAAPQFLPLGATQFVNSFGEVFDAAEYENDWTRGGQEYSSDPLDSELVMEDGAALCKFAGQTCYLSFGDGRTRNDPASVKRYFDNIKASGHGSVLEHAYYSMVVWGVDRAFSHELVRHRAGWAYSQLSQRYVGGRTLRFVERPEYQLDPALHASFEGWIDDAASEYRARAAMLERALAPRLEGMTATERRKAVNQAARNCLPNETETALVLTGNVRAWRHVVEQRASPHADAPIAAFGRRALEILRGAAPVLFDDYVDWDDDDRRFVSTPHRKV